MATSSKYYYSWQAKIKRDSLPQLQELSRQLNYVVVTPGIHDGDPSPPRLLDALAEAFRNDPEAVLAALRQIGLGENQTE